MTCLTRPTGLACPIDRFGETKVEHFDRAVVAHLDVGGLEIAVNDALFVRGLECFGDLSGDRQRVFD